MERSLCISILKRERKACTTKWFCFYSRHLFQFYFAKIKHQTFLEQWCYWSQGRREGESLSLSLPAPPCLPFSRRKELFDGSLLEDANWVSITVDKVFVCVLESFSLELKFNVPVQFVKKCPQGCQGPNST